MEKILIEVFYDPEYDCFGYKYHLKDCTKEDLIKILKELNGLSDEVLGLLGDKDYYE